MHAKALGIAICNSANLLNVPFFVLGGGVTRSGELWWNEVKCAARETALAEVSFNIVPAALSDDAPLRSAAFLANDLL